MKCLLDHNIPEKFKVYLSDFEVYTTKEMGWDRIENGELLTLMTNKDFNILITRDKDLSYQQNLTKFPISIILLNANNQQIKNYDSIIPKITQLLHSQLKTGITIIE